MKKQITRQEARNEIDSLFRKSNFTQKEIRNTKRLAMKFNIKLGKYKNLFCKKCLSMLKGKIRITKNNKIIECEKCNYVNKIKLS